METTLAKDEKRMRNLQLDTNNHLTKEFTTAKHKGETLDRLEKQTNDAYIGRIQNKQEKKDFLKETGNKIDESVKGFVKKVSTASIDQTPEKEKIGQVKNKKDLQNAGRKAGEGLSNNSIDTTNNVFKETRDLNIVKQGKKTTTLNKIDKANLMKEMENQIIQNKDLSNPLKEKLLNDLKTKMTSSTKEEIIKDIKATVKDKMNTDQVFAIVDVKNINGIDTVKSINVKDWVQKIKTEILDMTEFKVYSENKIKIQLQSDTGFIKLMITKTDEGIVIQSSSSDQLSKKVNEIISEVRDELRDRVMIRTNHLPESEFNEEENKDNKRREGNFDDKRKFNRKHSDNEPNAESDAK